LNIPIILASTSPRRIELMNQVGIPVVIVSPTSEEIVRKGEPPARMVARLAVEKAESVLESIRKKHGSALIVAADTTVVAPDGKTVLGKPKDPKDAVRMLSKLAGRKHTVITGYCVLSFSGSGAPKQLIRAIRSRVSMRPLTKLTIERYVETGEPMDKAGSYAAQGMGSALIESIAGSYTNVVGLPMAQLLMDLEKEFGISPFT
jgi:septum formation protein